MTHTSAPRPSLSRAALSAAVAGCTGLALLIPTNAGATQTRPTFTHDVAIAKSRFVPDNLGIDVGDTVRWVNTDAIEHNVRSIRGPREFGMAPKETLDRGERYRHTFNRKGTYHYECTIHGEQGEVRVGPKETTAAPERPGFGVGPLEQFRPRRVPPPVEPQRPKPPR